MTSVKQLECEALIDEINDIDGEEWYFKLSEEFPDHFILYLLGDNRPQSLPMSEEEMFFFLRGFQKRAKREYQSYLKEVGE